MHHIKLIVGEPKPVACSGSATTPASYLAMRGVIIANGLIKTVLANVEGYWTDDHY